jgi:Mn2+/Fe2+ NRAMP family transporter
MLTETLKTKTASLRLFALATLMTVVSSVTAQTLLEENFSSGFEEWTVVNPPGPL